MHLRSASTCVFPHMESIFDGFQRDPFMMLFSAPLLKTCIIVHLLLQYYVGSAKCRKCCDWLENNVNKCIILLRICTCMCVSMSFSWIHSPQKAVETRKFWLSSVERNKIQCFHNEFKLSHTTDWKWSVFFWMICFVWTPAAPELLQWYTVLFHRGGHYSYY